MHGVVMWLPLLLLFLLPRHSQPLTSADPEEMEEVQAEVIVDSSPCSATCGLGVKTQTLCFLKEGKTRTEGGDGRMEGRMGEGKEVGEGCRVRKASCLETWQCGLSTVTDTAGHRLEIDCLGEVMEAMGPYSWRVSWRYARGIISSDDSLFALWEAPQLDRVVLDPVREEDAGTYRCDVQDRAFRRVKRFYRGVRVLPPGILNLDYDSSLARWDWTGTKQNMTVVSDQLYPSRTLLIVVLSSCGLAGVLAGLTLTALYCGVLRRTGRERGGGQAEGAGGGGVRDGLVVPMDDLCRQVELPGSPAAVGDGDAP